MVQYIKLEVVVWYQQRVRMTMNHQTRVVLNLPVLEKPLVCNRIYLHLMLTYQIRVRPLMNTANWKTLQKRVRMKKVLTMTYLLKSELNVHPKIARHVSPTMTSTRHILLRWALDPSARPLKSMCPFSVVIWFYCYLYRQISGVSKKQKHKTGIKSRFL